MYQQIEWNILIRIVQQAGDAIMQIYQQEDFGVEYKSDQSPLTLADKKSNDVIMAALTKHFPDIPIISEENREIAFDERKKWKYCWIVDPLDGTKEFIKRNGEFTVNIGLAAENRIVMGIIYVPVSKETYFGRKGDGAWCIDKDGIKNTLHARVAGKKKLVMAGSRSHPSKEFDGYIKQRTLEYDSFEIISAGSSLKFCLVASGKAHEYPRLGPTMEWDTAAGHAIAEAAGARIFEYPSGNELLYNKKDLHNPYFIVSAC